ncbi:Maf1 regulator-domain-containing protein [Tribonema minus]|uniref:Repressor of RNA polymerase III transcription n=1 Tax=Tribonema minus TaxID=303371 RepID=A0A836CAL9_9STRA|nr:Maf1 regulator-domain-containing protein [Tribonema minus]|eukprot:TRINITY_DN1835_c0_g2_i1.p2 TRINITY_DN1835_c0_g2~~TRINITY_DN1835_c0_g2_i1.p2  ORF type:complete len:239 (+),score=105.21 TRINITY_DN1835_c0_g2_i1:339-1055(+)
MKFIEDPKLAELSNWITGKELGDKVLTCRIESFTCKMAGEDKKFSKKLEEEMDKAGVSPASAPNFGPLNNTSARRILIDLIITMNMHFPDYDFSKAGADHFLKQPDATKVVNAVNAQLVDLTRLYHVNFLEQLWGAVDESIKLKQCSVYSYVPDADLGDPFTDGSLWSFNYFFYNPLRKKMLYLTCIARNKFAARAASDAAEYDDGDDFDDYGDQDNDNGNDDMRSSGAADTPFFMDT